MLADLHAQWVDDNLTKASKAFDPSGRKKGSDYNQHHVDLDADGGAQDKFARAALALFAEPNTAERAQWIRTTVAAELQRIAGHDVTPGHDELHHYWTKGDGLPKWVGSAHPWTALYHHLVKYVNPEMAKRMASAWFHEVMGFWPGEKHAGAVRLPKGAGRSQLIRDVVAAELERMLGDDDDPIGELDDATQALLQALSELDAEREAAARAVKFDPGKHPRGPDGKFLQIVDQIKDAIKNVKPGNKHPLEGFNREQLRNAAKKRGIPLKRGEDWRSIADKLLFDLVPIQPKGAQGVQLERIPKVFGDAPHAYRVHFKGTHVGAVHGDENNPNGEWVPFPPTNATWHLENPGAKPTKAAAIQELIDSYAAAHAKFGPAKPKAAKAAAPKPKDGLNELDDRDLRDLAIEFGIKPEGKARPELIAAIRRKKKAQEVAAAKKALKEVPDSAKPFHRSLNGISDLQNVVDNVPITSEKDLAGGAIGDTRIREHADGTRVVWKSTRSKAENDAEQLSSVTARALGLRAPRIYRNDRLAVNMEFIEGTVAREHPDVGGAAFWAVRPKVVNSDEGRMMGLLDQLIDNQDRHNGNWIIDGEGHFVPIDHGFAFTGGNGHTIPMKPGAIPEYVKSPFGDAYYEIRNGSRVWSKNDLTKKDVAEIRRRLMALRADFEHVGRGDWHQFMIERLDAIGKQAQGNKSRLLPALV